MKEPTLRSTSLPAAILWDMDGTVVDTEPYWIEAETALVISSGGQWSHEDAMTLVGQSLETSAGILSRAGVPGTAQEIIDSLLRSVIARVTASGLPWRPGARELLTAAHETGIPQALVTMSFASFASLAVTALPVFDAVVTGDSVRHGKPHPEPYLTAADLLGVPISGCVAIEDSIPGVTSAVTAGARTLAVPLHVPIPPAPGLSRAATLEGITVADIATLASGRTFDALSTA